MMSTPPTDTTVPHNRRPGTIPPPATKGAPMPTRKWSELRDEVLSRPGAAERIEGARAETEAEIAAYEDREEMIAECNADAVGDIESGAFSEEFLQSAYEQAMKASKDAHEHPERLVRSRRRPDGI